MSLLQVENLGKAYRNYRSEWHRVGRWVGLPVQPRDEHWVLRHVTFDLRQGEAVGIVGQNGAGKSTLLKLITGTLKPSEGSVQTEGSTSAVLELGMGFNAELTGRQNARHATGLMGFTQAQINAAIDSIEEFAEIGEYFDEPVRTYSSGMQARLAFAVASAYRPEILIVDEALSVGDTYFQHKSFARIREYRKLGTSLLIVSHARDVIQTLCDRVILLENGLAIKDGSPEEVMDFYNAIIAGKETQTIEVRRLNGGPGQTRSGTGEARVEGIGLYNAKGEAVEIVNVGEPVELRIRAKVHRPVESLVLGYSIKDRLGRVMYGTNTWHTGQVIEHPKAGDQFRFKIAFPADFGVGSYSVQTALVDRDTHLSANYEWRDLALVFNVINFDKADFVGCLWNEPLITIEKCAA